MRSLECWFIQKIDMSYKAKGSKRDLQLECEAYLSYNMATHGRNFGLGFFVKISSSILIITKYLAFSNIRKHYSREKMRNPKPRYLSADVQNHRKLLVT